MTSNESFLDKWSGVINRQTVTIKSSESELDRLTARVAELEIIQERAEQVVIAYGMGWDLDGVICELEKTLPRPSEAARAALKAPDAL